MRTGCTCFLIVAAVALVGARPSQADDPKSDLKKLAGTWQMTRLEWFGKLEDKARAQKCRLTVEDNEMAWYDDNVANTSTQTAEITLDASKEPKWIDAEMTKGGSRGKKMLGIYKLDGETLDICWGEPGGKRPTKFTAKAGLGSGQVYATYKLDKSK